jgi:hypothetical protein
VKPRSPSRTPIVTWTARPGSWSHGSRSVENTDAGLMSWIGM